MAVPNPEREFDRLKKAVQSGLPPCLLVSGVSEFFRQAAMDVVAEAIPADVDMQTLDGNTDTDGRELNDLRGGTLFGSGAVLFVRRGESWLKKHSEGLLATIPKIAKGSSLVLEVKKLDKRTKLAKALLKAAESYEFRDLYSEPFDRSRSPLDAEMVGWLAKRSKEMGCALQAETAFMLMTNVGTRPAELLDEIERIKSRLDQPVPRGGLSLADLSGDVTCSFQSNPFEFAEAMLDYDRKAAMRALAAMYQRGAQGRDGARIDQGGLFPFITSWLYQCLTQLYEGRLLIDRGVPPRDVPGRIGVRTFVDRFAKQLRNNPTARVRRGIRLLYGCQQELRMTGEDPEWLLHRFLGRYFEGAA